MRRSSKPAPEPQYAAPIAQPAELARYLWFERDFDETIKFDKWDEAYVLDPAWESIFELKAAKEAAQVSWPLQM